MECKTFGEQITAAVDNALEGEERQRLEAHLAQCPACKSTFELEHATRSVVKSRCKRVSAPAHVLRNIVRQLDSEPREERGWWKEFVGSNFFRPAVGFALACAALIVLLNNDSVKRTNVLEASVLPANDVMKQALANYMAVSRKEIQPQFLSDRAELVQNYFVGKTEFAAFVPPMTDCKLIGGIVNEFSGKTLAHVVYTHQGTDIIYVYETCWETLQKGNHLHLSKDIQDEIRARGRYVATHPDGYSVVLWTKENTLCSAVAKLDPEMLVACLELDR